jgi:predicted RNA binding protein YcfA (HicA-like mRNA interferase family)
MMKILQKMGFANYRTHGSHHIMVHPDGRVATVPVHAGRTMATGTLKAIVKEKLLMTPEEFTEYVQGKGKREKNDRG